MINLKLSIREVKESILKKIVNHPIKHNPPETTQVTKPVSYLSWVKTLALQLGQIVC
jgi:hypothetical protein